MARPRASERADFGLLYLQPIVALGRGTLKDADALEWLRGYAVALDAYRRGTFNAEDIPAPSIFAWDETAWQRHLEAFVDGVDATEKRRASKRGKGVSVSKTPQEEGVSVSETRQVKRKEIKESEGKRSLNEANRSEGNETEPAQDASPALGRGGGYAPENGPRMTPPPLPIGFMRPAVATLTPQAEAERHDALRWRGRSRR